MNTKKQKSSSMAITFYVFAVIMLIVMAFDIYLTQVSLNSQMEQYSISFADEWKTIIFGYYLSVQNLLPLIGAILCYGIGYIINKVHFTQEALLACLDTSANTNKQAEEDSDVFTQEEIDQLKKEKAKKASKKANDHKDATVEEPVTETKAEEASKPEEVQNKEEVKKTEEKKKTTKAKSSKNKKSEKVKAEDQAEEPKKEAAVKVETEKEEIKAEAAEPEKTEETTEAKVGA